ncbi:hypothetical protein Goari_011454 [Gossypium aridum]|uniref:Aminotransferase-like plant mobile domain-containing protein n=1 Tax=Gossypium aridum TaxID=34290 RepID=A0A7J8WYS3_GOSAI|nr:hypothetical protein [Gossypium aridum]
MLATLYRELCQAMEPDKMSIGGYLLLLQSWLWWWLPFPHPQVNDPIHVSIGDKVEPWAELHGTTRGAGRY